MANKSFRLIELREGINNEINPKFIELRKDSNSKESLRDKLRRLPFIFNFKKYLKEIKEKRIVLSEIQALHEQWIDTMVNCGCFNEFNQTYGLNFTEKTIYGFKSELFLTTGLKFVKLKDLKEEIQDALGCLIVLQRVKRERVVKIDFVFDLQESLKYKVVAPLNKKENHERTVYLGNSYSGDPIFADMTTLPHILISGGTRSGKTKMEDCIITNLVSNYTPEQLELNLFQPAKSDLEPYADLAHCNIFADTIISIREGLASIIEIMNERTMKIRPMHRSFNGDNYIDYNKRNPKDKMKTIYCIFDEMSTLYESSTGDPKPVKDAKSLINLMIRRIAQYGAALGVFLICSLQRPTKDNLDPFVKSQSTILISFRQNNAMSSIVAFDDAEIALKLQPREFAYRIGNFESYGLVPWINADDIKEHVSKYLIPGSQAKKEAARREAEKELKEAFEEMKSKQEKKKGREKEKTFEDIRNDRIMNICYSMDKTYGVDSDSIDNPEIQVEIEELDVDKVKRRVG